MVHFTASPQPQRLAAGSGLHVRGSTGSKWPRRRDREASDTRLAVDRRKRRFRSVIPAHAFGAAQRVACFEVPLPAALGSPSLKCPSEVPLPAAEGTSTGMIWDAVCGPRQATPAPSPAAPPRIPPEHRRLAAAASSSSTCRAEALLPSCHSRRRRVALGHAHHTQSLPSNPLPPHALAHALAPLCLARRTRRVDQVHLCLCLLERGAASSSSRWSRAALPSR